MKLFKYFVYKHVIGFIRDFQNKMFDCQTIQNLFEIDLFIYSLWEMFAVTKLVLPGADSSWRSQHVLDLC